MLQLRTIRGLKSDLFLSLKVWRRKYRMGAVVKKVQNVGKWYKFALCFGKILFLERFDTMQFWVKVDVVQ